MKTLDGKVLVVTGAASGIGRALAVEAAARHARLALSDIDEAGLAETAQQATALGARDVHTQLVDVSDRAAMASYAAVVAAHFGQVDAVVNNAGVALCGDFLDLSYDDLEWMDRVNYWGVVHGSKEFLPHLIASGDGHLVNISSLFGLISMPGQSAYNAAKYAVRGLTEAIRIEMKVAGHPVQVSCVHPGGVKTAIARNARVVSAEDRRAIVDLFDNKLATMSPEKAAVLILDGMLAGKGRIILGMETHALFTASKVLGPAYQSVLARLGRTVLPAKVV